MSSRLAGVYQTRMWDDDGQYPAVDGAIVGDTGQMTAHQTGEVTAVGRVELTGNHGGAYGHIGMNRDPDQQKDTKEGKDISLHNHTLGRRAFKQPVPMV
jgi:hypothetical protein